nr:hypothetical protein [Micromonospora carbonacea]
MVDAFFTALRDHTGPSKYASLELTEDDKKRLATGGIVDADSVTRFLYSSEIPAPSAGTGFEENTPLVESWLFNLAERSLKFFSGLSAWQDKKPGLAGRLTAVAIERYREAYTNLSRDVPEFLIWSTFGEHAATRKLIREESGEVSNLLQSIAHEALLRFEKVLEAGRSPSEPRKRSTSRSIVLAANSGLLRERILPPGTAEGVTGITFPSVEEIYVEPRYKYCRLDDDSQIADEGWWEKREAYADISMFLAAHVTAPAATCLPLLVLGHPGAGKSLLTKVMAARLPESGYTAVRVPLRRIRADRPLFEQVQEALDLVTHRRVQWAELAEESRDTVRVVLLDGLDELLQASPGAHRSFFKEVSEFQRIEESQELPVVMVVTSRTIVADQVELPADMPVVKLEQFERPQILQWLRAWNGVNANGIASGSMNALDVTIALNQRELSSQPLLLLMLAVYAADPRSEPLMTHLSTAALYRQLLTSFATREVLKSQPTLGGKPLEEAVREHLWSLTIAAFAMFNRGRQYVPDYQLGSDFVALDDTYIESEIREADLGRRVAAQFFFIHSAEARIAGQADVVRSYEFLHATFGEYLIAQQIVTMFAGLEQQGRRRAILDIDELPFALLSCQALVGRMSILQLVGQLANEQSDDDSRRTIDAIDELIRTYRRRRNFDSYSRYRPTPSDRVLALAFYSLNLVSIRIAMSIGMRFRPEEVWSTAPDAWEEWQATVKLWSSVLDAGSWNAATSALERRRDSIRFMQRGRLLSGRNFEHIIYARLLGDHNLEEQLRLGVALTRKSYYYVSDDDWETAISSSVYSYLLSRGSPVAPLLVAPPERTSYASIRRIGILIERALKLADRPAHRKFLGILVDFLFSLPDIKPDPFALASLLLQHPEMARTHPRILEPEIYRNANWSVWLLFAANRSSDPGIAKLRATVLASVRGAPTGDVISIRDAETILQQILRSVQIPANLIDKRATSTRHETQDLESVHFNGPDSRWHPSLQMDLSRRPSTPPSNTSSIHGQHGLESSDSCDAS